MTADATQEDAPFVYTRGSTYVFVDRYDMPWEIRDYMRLSGRIVRLHYASDAAEYRVFSPAGAASRLYSFLPAESRERSALLLAHQLESALPMRSKTDNDLQHEPLLRSFGVVEETALESPSPTLPHETPDQGRRSFA